MENLNLRVCFLGLLLSDPVAAQTMFTEMPIDIPLPPSRGIACGDYDNDQWPDIFLPGTNPSHERAVLLGNQGNGHFADRTALIGPDLFPNNYKGPGVIFGDYDNDNDLDLYVPRGWTISSARDRLLRNDQGRFTDVTLAAGLTDSLPSGTAIWLDYDRDGWLDLYVGHWLLDQDAPDLHDSLYRNQGDGTFAEVTEAAGLKMNLYPPGTVRMGGSYGGMAAGDFNGDGWPDLYLGDFAVPNRLFLNDGQGHFRDATTGEIGDPGQAQGVAVGDIDNDGDLDLLICVPAFLFLNKGDGTFIDATSRSGLRLNGSNLAFIDYDRDGFLDVISRRIDGGVGPGGVFRNHGNNNHWLRIELVGTKSNRNGIGARLTATAGDLRQMREILGGNGKSQSEVVAHFGLGERTVVDRLEVRWPSGQVDVLTDIPADQEIRVFEGREEYREVHPFGVTLDTLVAGSTSTFRATVATALFEKDARITRVMADLSRFGGPEATPLVEAGAGAYRLDYPLVVGQNGVKDIFFTIDQATSLGPYWTQLSRQVTVVPSGDQVVFDEALAPDWQVKGDDRIKRLDLSETGVVHQGRLAGAFEGETAFSPWNVTFKPSTPVSRVGYTALRFSFRPGEVVPPETVRFSATLAPGKAVNLLENTQVDLSLKAWQVVEIPVEAFEGTGPIKAVTISGNFAGTFYLDDLRLVAATPSPATVVEEGRTTALPQSFSLSQNFPNPFNSETVVRFALPENGEVELAVYNLAGQRVVRLAEGAREAGNYTVRWDGRDVQGKELASGVYLYRLRVGAQAETRKLLLLR